MRKILLLLFSICFVDAYSQISTRLAIPPRLQWPNNDGYCGENSIQMCGLYYGNYISEGMCRRVAGGELLIYVNDTIALNAFSFTYSEWDPNAATPQYKNYLDWVKGFLYNKQPVIITVYVSGGTDPDYDHIIPAIGFYGKSVNTYTSTDSLTYNTNFDTVPFTTEFSAIYATRAGAGNSAPNPYYIPENTDYGVAVTGIKDPGKVTRPVHITLDSNEEPNVSLGVPPCILRATITCDSLTIGKSYALLRYNEYVKVPSTGFTPSGANSAVYFTASAITHTVIDSFMSDTAVFYRCIPYVATGINELADMQNALVYPNPTTGLLNIELPEGAEDYSIVNELGEVIESGTCNNSRTHQLYIATNGTYFIRFIKNGNVLVKKVEVVR